MKANLYHELVFLFTKSTLYYKRHEKATLYDELAFLRENYAPNEITFPMPLAP